jgi:hypothetical protein
MPGLHLLRSASRFKLELKEVFQDDQITTLRYCVIDLLGSIILSYQQGRTKSRWYDVTQKRSGRKYSSYHHRIGFQMFVSVLIFWPVIFARGICLSRHESKCK